MIIKPTLFLTIMASYLALSCGSSEPQYTSVGKSKEASEEEEKGETTNDTKDANSAEKEGENKSENLSSAGSGTETPVTNNGNTTPRPSPIPPASQGSGQNGILKQDPNNPRLFLFEIPANHGRVSWNTPQTVMQLKVGDTLRIINRDASAPHQLHTNGAPCPHGGNRRVGPNGGTFGNTANIPVNGYIECDIATAVDFSSGSNAFYNHAQGPQMRIFLRSVQ